MVLRDPVSGIIGITSKNVVWNMSNVALSILTQELNVKNVLVSCRSFRNRRPDATTAVRSKTTTTTSRIPGQAMNCQFAVRLESNTHFQR